MKYLYLAVLLVSLSSCYNPYMRINQGDKTLSRSSRCTSPILTELPTRTAGIFIISRNKGGDLGKLLAEKNDFLLLDVRQQFPENWINEFEQGVLLSIPSKDIFHKSDAYQLMDIGEQRLSQLSAILGEYPELSFIVEGHHASDPLRKKNLKIAFRQVKAIGRYLRKNNVEKKRFEVVSYGCQQRLTPNGQENNRIEIALVME